ncbi:interferon-induced protein with tetratricopeptide repeats 5-like isoform X1 [Sardina pilchardus]|uniref:interferon-induced protein with tetratricopeptide repeats 5-like isoform X1 n=1 Tax=Sardina pilchardus TaxID=27697 RepID=UPI002E0F84D2
MNSSDDIRLETKLQQLEQLECHFTWDLAKESADLSDLQTRLEDQIELDLSKKAGAIRSYCFLAYVRYLQGFLDDALTNLLKSEEKGREYHGDDCERFLIVTYGNLAWLHYLRRSYSQCESYLEKLVGIKEKFPTGSPTELHPDVYGQKGWTYLKFAYKYYGRAKQCFEKALELEPEESEWNIGYAIALYRTEDIRRSSAEDSLAVKQLRLAKQKSPDNAKITVLLGLRLFDFDKYDEAESLIEEALEMDPTNPHVIRYVSKNFRCCGNLDRAIALLKRAIDRTEKSAFLHHQLALCYKRKMTDLLRGDARGRGQEVRQLIDKCTYHLQLAITLRPNFLLAKAELALLYGQDRRIENTQAEEMFKAILKEAEERTDMLQIIHHYCGEFHHYKNNSESQAVHHYTECMRLGQDRHFGKQSAYHLKRMALKRVNRDPSDGEALGILGFIHKARGKKSEAIEYYEKALEFDQNNEEYLNALSELERLSLE